MQIKVRGSRIEYLRSVYDPAKRRSVQKTISPEEFTPAEKAEAEAFNERNKASVLTSQQTHAAVSPSFYIDLIAAGIEGGARPENEPALWESIKKMQKALRKAGIRRPIPVPKPSKKVVKKTVKRKPRSKPAA